MLSRIGAKLGEPVLPHLLECIPVLHEPRLLVQRRAHHQAVAPHWKGDRADAPSSHLPAPRVGFGQARNLLGQQLTDSAGKHRLRRVLAGVAKL